MRNEVLMVWLSINTLAIITWAFITMQTINCVF